MSHSFTTSHLPAPPPIAALPPKLTGPVRHFLSVTVSKLVWTNAPPTTSSLPRVRLVWWGDDGPGTIFSPQSIGTRSNANQSGPSSSLPVPLSRSKTWTSPSSFSSPGIMNVQYPVRCSKRQLSAYFRDMGGLVLQVLVDGKVVAHSKVNDLSPLVADPSKPVNGFFPVFETRTIYEDAMIERKQGQKLGELHLAMVLESALASSDVNVPTGEYLQDISRGKADTAGVREETSSEHHPSEPPKPPVDQSAMAGDGYTSAFPSPNSVRITSTATSPLLRKAGELRDEIDELLLEQASHEPGSDSVSSDMNKGNRAQEALRLQEPDRTETEPRLQHLTSGTSVRERLKNDASMSRQPSKQLLAALTDDPDKVDYRLVATLDDLDTSSDPCSYSNDKPHISSDSSDSDILEDDLIIEALNSSTGKNFIGQRARESGYGSAEHDPVPGHLDFDTDDEEDPNISNDERKRRAVFGGYAKARYRSLPREARLQPVLSVDKLTSLGRIQRVRVRISAAELGYSALPISATNLVIHYGIPGLSHARDINAKSNVLPRWPISRNLSRRSMNSANEPSRYVVQFDYEQSFPCAFGGSLVDQWLAESMLFKVSADVKPYARASKQHWSATSLLKCADVLMAESFKWEGRVPMYIASHDDQDVERAAIKGKRPIYGHMGRNALRKGMGSSGIHIGDVVVSIELLSDALPQELGKELHARESAGVVMGDAEQSLTAQPLQTSVEASCIPAALHYCHLHISTARSLSILPTLDNNSVLLYLAIRLFSSSTPPIESPLIPFQPPFDLKTGRINDPPDFDFSYTIPLALTKEFIDTNSEKPVIVEVWVVDGESKQTSKATKSVVMAEHVDRGAKLLGLVRLPFHHLLGAHVAGWKDMQNADLSEEMPVMVPGADYAIMDPFSGTAKGWINAFMALGTWGQIRRVRNKEGGSAGGRRQVEETDGAHEEIKVRREQKHKRLTHDFRTKRQTMHAADVGDSAIGQRKAAECKIQVCIRRACGLRALIRGAIAFGHNSSDDQQGDDHYTALDFAKEIGTNTYVCFRLFPPAIADSISARAIVQDDDENIAEEGTVVTPIVAHSFTPNWNYAVILTISHINTDLLRWMRDGGEAQGEVWHRMPEEYGEEDILLGVFGVPLKKVLSRSEGVDTWVPIIGAGEADGDAAVNVRVKFRRGPTIEDEEVVLGSDEWRRLSVAVERVTIPAREDDVIEQYLKRRGPTTIVDEVYCRWKHPTSSEKNDELSGIWKESPLAAARATRNHKLMTVDLDYRECVDLHMTPSIVRWFREKNFEVEVWRKNKEQGGDTIIGTAYLDIASFFTQAMESTPGGSKAKYEVGRDVERSIDDSFVLINPDSPDLMGASIHLRLELAPLSTAERVRVSCAQKTDPTTDSRRMERDSRVIRTNEQPLQQPRHIDRIPVEVTVERALHLPLMSDPFAEYLPSPFVTHDEQQLIPPNAFVTFQWYEGEDDESTTNQTYRTQVTGAQRCPTWNFTVSVYQERSEQALRKLKLEKAVVFKVWHMTDVNVARRHLGNQGGQSPGEIGDEARSELIGTAKVDLGSLFAGLKEIHGWYHVLDSRGVSKGQLLIKVHPAENFAAALREFTGGVEHTGFIQKGFKNGRRPLQEICGKNAVVPPVAITFAGRDKTQLNVAPIANTLAGSISTAQKNQCAQRVDTWVWNGNKWEHRQVEVRPVDNELSGEAAGQKPNASVIETPAGIIEESPVNDKLASRNDTYGTTSERKADGELRRSLRKTMNELDALNRKLKEKRQEDSDSPLTNKDADALETFDASRSIAVRPAFSETEAETHPTGAHSLVSSQVAPLTAEVRQELEQDGQSHTTKNSHLTGIAGRSPLSSPEKAKGATVHVAEKATQDATCAETAEGRELRVSDLGPIEAHSSPLSAKSHEQGGDTVVDQNINETAVVTEELPPLKAAPARELLAPSSGPTETIPQGQSVEKDEEKQAKPLQSGPESSIPQSTHANEHSEPVFVTETLNAQCQVPAVDDAELAWTSLAKRFAVVAAETRSGDNVQEERDESELEEADNEAGLVEHSAGQDSFPSGNTSEAGSDDEQSHTRLQSKNGESIEDYDGGVRTVVSQSQNSASTGSLRDPDLSRPSHTKKRIGKENLNLVPDDDNNETSDDDIYSILAYRRLAAAAAAGIPSSHFRIPKRTIDQNIGKPPLIPERPKARTLKPYDPFGIRSDTTQIPWKAPVESDTENESSGPMGSSSSKRERPDKSERQKHWRALLEEKSSGIDREHIARLQKIFSPEDNNQE